MSAQKCLFVIINSIYTKNFSEIGVQISSLCAALEYFRWSGNRTQISIEWIFRHQICCPIHVQFCVNTRLTITKGQFHISIRE